MGRPVAAITSRARIILRVLEGSMRSAATGSRSCRRRCKACVPNMAASSSRWPRNAASGSTRGIDQPSTIELTYSGVPPPALQAASPTADNRRRHVLVHRKRKGLIRIDEVHHVVSHAGAVCVSGLVGADVHEA